MAIDPVMFGTGQGRTVQTGFVQQPQAQGGNPFGLLGTLLNIGLGAATGGPLGALQALGGSLGGSGGGQAASQQGQVEQTNAQTGAPTQTPTNDKPESTGDEKANAPGVGEQNKQVEQDVQDQGQPLANLQGIIPLLLALMFAGQPQQQQQQMNPFQQMPPMA